MLLETDKHKTETEDVTPTEKGKACGILMMVFSDQSGIGIKE